GRRRDRHGHGGRDCGRAARERADRARCAGRYRRGRRRRLKPTPSALKRTVGAVGNGRPFVVYSTGESAAMYRGLNRIPEGGLAMICRRIIAVLALAIMA